MENMNMCLKANPTKAKQDLVQSGAEIPSGAGASAVCAPPTSCSQCFVAVSQTTRIHLCVGCKDSVCGDCAEIRVSAVKSSLLRQRLCKKCASACTASSLFTPSKLKLVGDSSLWSADTETDSDSDDDKSVTSAASAKTNLMASALQGEGACPSAEEKVYPSYICEPRHPVAMMVLCIVTMLLTSGILLIGLPVASTHPAITAQTGVQESTLALTATSPFSAVEGDKPVQRPVQRRTGTVQQLPAGAVVFYEPPHTTLSHSIGKMALAVGEVRREVTRLIAEAPKKFLLFIFRLFSFGAR
jgi:hypothetical protein